MHGVRTFVRALGLAVLLGWLAAAQAQSGLATGNDPSLILLIWDPVAKVSYSHDTGLQGTSLRNGLNDAGSQQFWTLDPATDSSFAQFLRASPDLSQDQWLVIGGGKASSGTTAGSSVIFSTMINTILGDDGQPVLNPEWDYLTGVANGLFRSRVASFPTALYNPLSAGNGTAYNNYATAAAGSKSSFDTAASNAYLGNMKPVLVDSETGLSSGESMFGGNGDTGGGFDTGNLIGTSGSSSWFYYLTPSSTDPTDPQTMDPVTVDAFSNSAQLAYWGLARTTNTGNQQELVLSFTLPSAITQASTAGGVLRRNQTDYAAQYGAALQVKSPTGEFSGWTASPLLQQGISAVPEPGCLLLMGLGLAGVFAAARRRNLD